MNTNPNNENFDFHAYNDSTGDSMNIVHSKTIMALSGTVNRLRMANALLTTKLAVAQGTVTHLGCRLNASGINMTMHDKIVVDTYKDVQHSRSMEEAETVVNRAMTPLEKNLTDLNAHIQNLMEQIDSELRNLGIDPEGTDDPETDD